VAKRDSAFAQLRVGSENAPVGRHDRTARALGSSLIVKPQVVDTTISRRWYVSQPARLTLPRAGVQSEWSVHRQMQRTYRSAFNAEHRGSPTRVMGGPFSHRASIGPGATAVRYRHGQGDDVHSP